MQQFYFGYRGGTLSSDGGSDPVMQRCAVTGLFAGLWNAMLSDGFVGRFPKVSSDKHEGGLCSDELRVRSGLWTTSLGNGTLRLRFDFGDLSLGTVEFVFHAPEFRVLKYTWVIGDKEGWGPRPATFATMFNRLRRACVAYMLHYGLNSGISHSPLVRDLHTLN